jgi:2-oxoisovalerate dehydrogenase E1 component alpha subunit
MPGYTVDGNDPLEVYKAVKEAADRGRRGEGPTLIEAVMYRLTAHSSDDDDRTYRSREEVEEAKKKDPIYTFSQYLKEAGVLTDELEQQISDELMQIINEATDYAEKAPYAEPESALKHVYGE